MPRYGEIKFDYLTFTSGGNISGDDLTISASGLVINPSFSGLVTCVSGLNVSGDLNVGGNIINPSFSGDATFNEITVTSTGTFNNLTVTGRVNNINTESNFVVLAGHTQLATVNIAGELTLRKNIKFISQPTDDPGSILFTKNDTSVVSGQTLGELVVSGNSTNHVYQDCAAISFVAEDDHTSTNKYTSTVFKQESSNGNLFQVLRLRSNGEILFNSNATALDVFPAGTNDGILGQFGFSLKDGSSASDSSGGGVLIKQNKVSSARFFAKFYASDGDDVGAIKNTNTATQFIQTSDYRLKENERPILNGIELVKQLNPLYFNFKKEPNHTMQGFFAHEVQEVVPDAVHGAKDGVDENNRPIYQGIDSSYMVPCLTAAIKELIAKVEVLENELAALKTE